jgi:hypothetical protein
MPLKCDPARKIVDDSGFPMTPDRLLKLCGPHVWVLEVFKTMISTCGPYNLGGSTTGPAAQWPHRAELGRHDTRAGATLVVAEWLLKLPM